MTQTIALQAIPNQALSVRLDDAFYEIVVQEINGEMAISITRDSVVVVTGQRIVSEAPIIPYRYLEDSSGNFYVSNIAEEMIYYTQFGVTQTLTYVSAAELLEIRAP